MKKQSCAYKDLLGYLGERENLKAQYKDWFLERLSAHLNGESERPPYYVGASIRDDLLRVGIDAKVTLKAFPSVGGCVLYYDLSFEHHEVEYTCLSVYREEFNESSNAKIAKRFTDFVVEANNEVIALMHSKNVSKGDLVLYYPALLEGEDCEEMRVHDVCCLGVLGASGQLVLWSDLVGVVK